MNWNPTSWFPTSWLPDDWLPGEGEARVIADGAITACAPINTALYRSVCMGQAVESHVRLGEVGCSSVKLGKELGRCAPMFGVVERAASINAINEASAQIVGPIYNWVDLDD